MLWLLASVLLLLWIVLLAFKVTAAAIHVLLAGALVQRRARPADHRSLTAWWAPVR
jgi:hypothetical protein